ncbi:hypothetical protein [Methanosarcina horonobensis]|uniref:hypothetical protein n=1 Tax=Methanosarcina horonobensis TaxID=418008 RepID=UPI000A86F0FE
MNMIKRFKVSFSKIFNKLFKKKRSMYRHLRPPNAGKTTLSNRILRDWVGSEETMARFHTSPTRPGMQKGETELLLRLTGTLSVLILLTLPGLQRRSTSTTLWNRE